MPVNLLDLDADALAAYFVGLGEKPFRAKQVLRWLHHFGVDDLAQMTDIARSLRERLATEVSIIAPPLVSDKMSHDGTRKFLFSVGSGNAIETVFIPEDDRGTLCISSQAGCALDCAFCSTGKQGFNRNLSTAEIIGQLWMANRALGAYSSLGSSSPVRPPHPRPLSLEGRGEVSAASVDTKPERIISNVVMMGMGEPLTNFDNVVSALHLMLDDNAYGLSRRRVTVSTSGIVPAMDRLRDACPVALAVSLHAPNDALRDELVPINKKYPLKALLAACNRYLEKAPRDFITFEYVMLDGVNDSDEHARELIKIAEQVSCKFNLIPFNPFPASHFKRSPSERIRSFANILMGAGIITTTRKTRGDDIDAACGQLAGQVKDKTRRVIRLQSAGQSVNREVMQ